MDEYGTNEAMTTYATARGLIIPLDTDDAEMTAARLIASEWLDGRYGRQFSGYKTGLRDQEREWPRTGAYDDCGNVFGTGEIPREVERATYEAAIRHLNDPGSLTVDFTPGKYKRASVDGAVSVEFSGFTEASQTQIQIPVIDRIIAPILTAENGNYASYSGASSRV